MGILLYFRWNGIFFFFFVWHRVSPHLLSDIRLIFIQGGSNNGKPLPTMTPLKFEPPTFYWAGTLRLKSVTTWANHCWWNGNSISYDRIVILSFTRKSIKNGSQWQPNMRKWCLSHLFSLPYPNFNNQIST